MAIGNLVQAKDKVALFTGPAASATHRHACAPNHVHWVYDTWSMPHIRRWSRRSQGGGNTWFFIAADYAFGHPLAATPPASSTRAGGKVLGSVHTPFPGTTDFSVLLCRRRRQRRQGDRSRQWRQRHGQLRQAGAEFGITRAAKLAALLMMLHDLHGVGLATAQGLLLSEPFYWDLNEGTRAFGKRFGARMSGWMPSMIQAGDYAAILHCLKAMAALGIDRAKASGRATVAQMKAMPTDDTLFGKGSVRPDGRVIHECTCSRSSRRRKAKTPGTTTSWSRRRQPSRHSGR